MLQAVRSPVRIPDEVDFFNLPNPFSRNMARGWTESLTEMSTRKFPWGKGGRRVGLTTLPPPVNRMSDNVEPQPLTVLRASMACIGIALPDLTLCASEFSEKPWHKYR
jgi:hypothetical protein